MKLAEILARFREPSSWAGIALIISLITGKVLPPELMASGAQTISDLVAVGAAIAAVLMREKGPPCPPKV